MSMSMSMSMSMAMDGFTERSAIVIMAKRPVPGNVKTRLCPPLSPEESAALYAAFLEDTIHKVDRIGSVIKFIALDSDSSLEHGMTRTGNLSVPGSYTAIDQGKGDLGERMSRILGILFQSFDRVLVIGADSPTMPYEVLESALTELSNHDVVIGPSHDGGYYLLGLREHFEILFDGINWSTDVVLHQTLDRIRSANLTVKQLLTWYDIDTHANLLRLAAELRENPSEAPATSALLNAINY
ncbi:TIGR04282 family arsenosugar biosynthesis glycosyltransferase [Candidatus Aquicultor secundus]|nr:TIGR04282 family arsenosugar biosynthesis glycosyltransferase [Candidatus Aquicultor secundus]